MDKNQNENYHSRNDGVSGFDYERFIMEKGNYANSVANKRKTAKPGATSDTAAGMGLKRLRIIRLDAVACYCFCSMHYSFAFLVREIGIIGQVDGADL